MNPLRSSCSGPDQTWWIVEKQSEAPWNFSSDGWVYFLARQSVLKPQGPQGTDLFSKASSCNRAIASNELRSLRSEEVPFWGGSMPP
jgi:hypothetical protein